MFVDALEGLDFLLHLPLTKSSWQRLLILHIVPNVNVFLFDGINICDMWATQIVTSAPGFI